MKYYDLKKQVLKLSTEHLKQMNAAIEKELVQRDVESDPTVFELHHDDEDEDFQSDDFRDDY